MTGEHRINVNISEREQATILAALRYFTSGHQTEVNEREGYVHCIATNAGLHESLTEEEVNNLAERFGGAKADADV